MGYAPKDGFVSIRCGNFDIEDNFLIKEIEELEKNNIDVYFQIVDVERIYKEKENKQLPNVGGCDLPFKELVISISQNTYFPYLYDIFLLMVDKVVSYYIEKTKNKKNIEEEGKIEIIQTEEETSLKISGKINKYSAEVAKEYIDKVFK